MRLVAYCYTFLKLNYNALYHEQPEITAACRNSGIPTQIKLVTMRYNSLVVNFKILTKCMAYAYTADNISK